ncbi:MAG: c-type cytochrome [Verrucomicrobia bacterium]|nr:c-type cytochrome [Verrucomicrobiota bacterium]
MKPILLLLSLTILSGVGAAEIDRAQLALFGKLPAEWPNPANPATPEKIALGRMLYFEPRLSLSQEISCNSCHGLSSFGVDGKAFSDGHAGHKTGRNSPTVFNAAGHLAQFWDGRAADVEAQAKGPILAGGEMAMPDEAYVIKVLKSIPGYPPHFAAAFPGEKDPVTYDNVAKAIGAFERKLSTPSRFDDYLGGKEDALNADEKRGLAKFLSTGCTTCHNGPMVGGLLYQKVGLVKPWPFLNDEGRSKISGNPAEKGFFKVPSLRNIAETSPYFHDGSVNSLEIAVALMAEYQLGRQLPTEDVADIATFLRSLTGRVDAVYVEAPALPESGPTTPAPKHD